MSTLIDMNENLLRNLEYSLEFFDLNGFTLDINNPSMMENNEWLTFLDNTDTLDIPIIDIPTFNKTQKIWYRNESVFDKIIVEVDNSSDNNIIEFIAKKTKYKNIVLDDLKKLGCIINIHFIDNDNNFTKKRLYVGRCEINSYTDKKLSIKITQLNKILKDSDFEKYVVQYPTGACYNYISLEQAFANIYNIPHNMIDDYSYHCTPFVLNKESYIPEKSINVDYIDDNLNSDNFQIYAEDYVGNTNKTIHTQFFYFKNSPECGIKLTEYDSAGNVINTDTSYVLNWNVWNNTEEAYQKAVNYYGGENYVSDAIYNYQRYFRPFKVVIASGYEEQAFVYGNYRTKKNYLYPNAPLNIIDNTFYDPEISNYLTSQEKIELHDRYRCRSGDELIYFEVLGDIRYSIGGINSANVLFDSYSNIYVYNKTRDIVYFDHIATQVQSTPLPKQWLEMKNYITTDRIYFASNLHYDSGNNSKHFFLSNIKPLCAVLVPNSIGDDYGSHQFVASEYTRKLYFDEKGLGGVFVGTKTKLHDIIGAYNMNPEDPTYDNTAKTVISEKLDYTQFNSYPKSVRISDDCKSITYLTNVNSNFTVWDGSVSPVQVKSSAYKYQNEFPTFCYLNVKSLYKVDSNGKTFINQREYDNARYINYDCVIDEDNSQVPLFSEISPSLFYGDTGQINGNFLVLGTSTVFTPNNGSGGDTRVFRLTTDYKIQSNYLRIGIDKSIPSVNFTQDSDYNLAIYWCYEKYLMKDLAIQNSFPITSNEYVLRYYILGGNRYLWVQEETELIFYKVVDNLLTNIYSTSNILGLDYLLPTSHENLSIIQDDIRDRFVNPNENQSNILVFIGDTINEPVRLLSFTGNRYIAGDRLASSFFKNSAYDGNGVLNIGVYSKRYYIDDYSIVDASQNKYKFDTIEYFPYDIEKNGFKQLDNNNATTKELDDNELDKNISISMWSNKDIQMDVTISRTGENQLTWIVINEFGEESDTIIENGFNFMNIDLTGIFEGITITIDLYNTFLSQGDKFRGTIEKRKLTKSTISNQIVDINKTFPFIDNNTTCFKFPFLYSQKVAEFHENISNYFVYNNSIREQYTITITVPTLLYFDSTGNPFNINNLITLNIKDMYIEGYNYDSKFNIISKYKDIGYLGDFSGNYCDYYIEEMSYNKKDGTTTLKLISV